jgi:hypothetical protein
MLRLLGLLHQCRPSSGTASIAQIDADTDWLIRVGLVGRSRDTPSVESEKAMPLFEKEEQYARAAASSWIAHPAVRSALDAARPNAVAVTALLLPHMADQVQCMRFCWRVCGIGPVYPDGSEEPNPFDPEGPAPWPLTKSEHELAGYIAAVFHSLVRTVAAELCDVGVPLDPEWDGDQAVLAVLMLLPALGYLIPWEGKIDEFAEVLQPPGVSAFTPDGRSASARDGRPDSMARNADRIRKLIRAENSGRELHVSYARGTGRALPRATVIRREILAEILADDPAVTVSDILRTYDYSEHKPGGRLRHQLRQRLEAEGWPVPGKPSQSVLYDDFTYLSGASATGTEKDSG